jgi:DNA replication protein DnaD
METNNYTSGKVGTEDLLKKVESLTSEERTQFIDKITERGWVNKHQNKFQGGMNESNQDRDRAFSKQKGHQTSSVGENGRPNTEREIKGSVFDKQKGHQTSSVGENDGPNVKIRENKGRGDKIEEYQV